MAVPYNVLSVIHPAFNRRITLRALHHRKKATPAYRSKLNDAIARRVRFINDRLADPLQSPPLHVANEIKNQRFYNDSELIHAILLVWVEAERHLAEQVRRFVAECGLPRASPELPESGFAGSWPEAEMRRYADQYVARYPGSNWDDVALMLCCVTGLAPDWSSEATRPSGAPAHTGAVSQGAVPVEGGLAELGADRPAAEAQPEPAAQLNVATEALPDVAQVAEAQPEPEAPPTMAEAAGGPDGEADLEELISELQGIHSKAQLLLEQGGFADLLTLAEGYAENVRRVARRVETAREQLRDLSEALTQRVQDVFAPADSEEPLLQLRAIRNALSGGPTALIAAQKAAREVAERVRVYEQNRHEARAAYAEAQRRYRNAMAQLSAWREVLPDLAQGLEEPQVDDAAPTAQFGHAAKRLSALCAEIESAIADARARRKTELVERCLRLNGQLAAAQSYEEYPQLAAALEQIFSILDADPSDDRLLSLDAEVAEIEKQAKAMVEGRSAREAARDYLRAPTQARLMSVLDALWRQGRWVEGFILLSSSLRSGRWESGSCLPDNGLDGYLQGMRLCAAADSQVSAAIALFSDGYFLPGMLTFKRSAEKLSLLVLISSLLMARPGALSADLLWEFEEDLPDHPMPLWRKLAEQLMLDKQPALVRREQLASNQLDGLRAQLNSEFTREGGRYAKLAGSGSKGLLNMEQKQLMPDMEKFWRAIAASKPSQPDWQHLRAELQSLKAEEMFAEYCSRNGFTPDSNKRFKADFENRIHRLLELMRDYVAACEERAALDNKEPIIWEDLIDELRRGVSKVGPAVMAIATEAIEEAMSAGASQSASAPVSAEGFSQRIIQALLKTEDVYLSLAQAVLLLANDTPANEAAWQRLTEAIIQSLAHPMEADRAAEMYLQAGLPEQALLIARKHELPERVREAEAMRKRLDERVKELQAELRRAGVETPPGDDLWLAEGRYGLLIDALENRLEECRSRERQREEAQRREAEQLYRRANELELLIAQRTDLPLETKNDLLEVLSAVRRVYTLSELHKLAPAQNVLDEVDHFLHYPGARAEDVMNARLALLNTAPIQSAGADVREGDAAADVLDATQAAKLTDKQREVRAELLNFWKQMRGLPMDPDALTKEQLEVMKQFAKRFAMTTMMFHAEPSGKNDPITNVWAPRPVPHFETRFQKPGMASFDRRDIVLIFVTERELGKQQMRRLDRILEQEDWLRKGAYLVFVTPLASEQIKDWVRRALANKPCVVLDDPLLRQIVNSADNPTATGVFRRTLLRVSGPDRFDVFKYENLVDKDREIFCGRRDWLDRLAISNDSHAIYGGRKIGKSSLLNALEKELKARGVRAAYVSLEGPAGKNEGLPACEEILQKLEAGVSCDSFAQFKAKMTSYLAEEATRQVVVLLDEVDRYIIAQRAERKPHDLIHTLRSLYQENRGRCRFILAGSIEMWRHIRLRRGALPGPESPWVNFLRDDGCLEGLPSADAQEIVRQGFQEMLGVRLDAESLPRKIVERTTGHPAFVQRFCSKIHELLHKQQSDTLTLDTIEAVFRDRGPNNFLSFVNSTLALNLNDLTRLIVYLLAVEEKDKFTTQNVIDTARSYDDRARKVAEGRWGESMDELLVTSVVRQIDANTYAFSVPSYPAMLREFSLANKGEVERLLTSVIEAEAA